MQHTAVSSTPRVSLVACSSGRGQVLHPQVLLGVSYGGRKLAISSSSPLVCRAGEKDKDGPLGLVNSAVDSLTNFVPETVPRPVAKTGVTVLGGLFVLGLLQKVVSGIFTLVVMGALGYWWLTKSSPPDDGDIDDTPKKGNRPASSKKGDDLKDPLMDDMQRIMDKYK